jgi:hypothetical protein
VDYAERVLGIDDTVRLLEIVGRLRGKLQGWGPDVSRHEALAACLVLVGTEAGLQADRPLDAEAFVRYASNVLAWAFALGKSVVESPAVDPEAKS